MNMGASTVVWVFVGLIFSRPLFAQSPPEWRLSQSPTIEVGRSGIALHRVVDADLLSSGELAIADAGNGRILIVSPHGQLLRTLGRTGEGPGEFRSLYRMFVSHDTLVAYDVGLSRVAIYLADGMHVRTRSMPQHNGQPVLFRDALSVTRYIGSAPVRSSTVTSGLSLDSIAVLTVDVATGNVGHIMTRQWQHMLTVIHGNGSTRYGTPFLGQTQIAAVAWRIVIVPRDGSGIEIVEPGTALPKRIPLPMSRRPFDRSVVASHRDSLLAVMNRARTHFPGAADRVREAFGQGFPVPAGEHRPLIQKMTVVGSDLWLQSIPEAKDAGTTWYILDPANARLAGRISLPRDWTVLGGNDRMVVIKARDDLDVEYVRVYSVIR